MKAGDDPRAVEKAHGLKFGLVLGAMIPDVDFFLLGPFYVIPALSFLASAARKTGTDQGFLPKLKVITAVQWVMTAIYLGLSFVLGGSFDIAHYAAFILLFFPLCLYVTVKMKKTIWAL